MLSDQGTSTQTWWADLVDASNVLSAGLGGLAIVLAVGVGSARYQAWRLLWFRWRTFAGAVRNGQTLLPLSGQLTDLDPLTKSQTPRAPSRGGRARAAAARKWSDIRDFYSLTSPLVNRRLTVPGARAAEELAWIGHLIGAQTVEREGPASTSVDEAVTFLTDLDPDHRAFLSELALGYETYASLLRRKWILRAAAAPLIEAEYKVARSTADLLHAYARQSRAPAPTPKDRAALLFEGDPAPWIRCGGLAQGDSAQDSVRLVARPDVRLPRSTMHFSSVGISYVPLRWVWPGGPAEARTPEWVTRYPVRPANPSDTAHGSSQATTPEEPREFDGVMTRLHGRGWRHEVDPLSGRQRLHLCVSETSFFAFRATSWRERTAGQPVHGEGGCRLLSVNLVLVDDDERVVLVQRNAAVTHPGTFAGAASGACEIVAREGMPGDLDDNGLPDPRRTVIREAREETGYDISAPEWKLQALGLVQVRSARDERTYVLTYAARLPWSADQFRIRRGTTDDDEGTWEIGGESLVVDLRAVLKTPESLQRFVRWIRSDPQIVAHGVGALLLLLTLRLERDARRTEPLYGARISHLGSALLLPPTSVVPRRPRSAWKQPLWSDADSEAPSNPEPPQRMDDQRG